MTKEEVMKKVQKLMNLANCKTGNVNETARAAEKASKLMADYNIQQFELQEEDQVDEITYEYVFRGGRTPSWRVVLLRALCDTNTCKLLIAPGSGIRVYGREDDISTVRYMFRLYCGQIDQLLKAYKVNTLALTGRKPGRTLSNDFRIGAADAIGDKLLKSFRDAKREAKANASVSTALIRMDALERKVLDEVRKVSGGCKWGGGSGAKTDAYDDGYHEGSKVKTGQAGNALNPARRQLTNGF